jgi:hypothetical protein
MTCNATKPATEFSWGPGTSIAALTPTWTPSHGGHGIWQLKLRGRFRSIHYVDLPVGVMLIPITIKLPRKQARKSPVLHSIPHVVLEWRT